MKVVYFNYLYDIDNLAVGSAVHVNEFEREFKKLGVQIDTFYLNANHNCNDSKGAAGNILKRKFSKAFNHINAFMKNVNQLIKENRIIEEKRPDLILTRYNLLNFSSALLAKIKKVPIVLEVNAPQAYESKEFYRHSYHWPFLSELIEKVNLKIADAVIVVSEELKNYFVKRKVAPQKIFVIPNGVDPEKFYPFGKTKSIIDKYKLKDFVVIGFVGSFHYWHGIDNLIDLIKRVLSKYDNVCFLLIGKGALNDEIEQVINEHIKSKVILLGYVPHKDVPKYLSIIDIAIAPYPKMQFFYFSPLKIFEYMASGKAVVSSKIGQIGRIIKDGENGLLFEPDNKEELFSKVSQLIENEEMRKKLGGQARASVIKNYTWKVNAKNIFDICNSVLNNGNNTNKRINLLQIVNGFAIGGAEKNLLELVRLIDRKKYRVVICSVGQGGPLQREFEALGFNVYVVTKKHRLGVSQVFKVAKIMRDERIDIVQMTLFYAEIIGILAALLAKIKIRISWEVYTHSKKFRHRLAYRLIYKLVNCVVAVSDETRKTIIKDRNLDVKKAITVHYGVDFNKFNASNGRSTKANHKLNHNNKIIGVVARLTDQKGHIYLIKAAPEIIKKFPTVKFVFVGDGPLRDSLKAEIEKLGLSCYFEFLGFRNEVNELLNSFDIFVLPSLFEGLPNVLLEAMACAKPIVATSVAGVPEVVVDGFTGFLVPPQNPEGLAKRISDLLANDELSVKMGKAARKRIENNFSLKTQVDNFQALYSKLLTHNPIKL